MIQVVSGLFVVLWSTGFLVGRALVGSADPDAFLVARFTLTALLLGAAAALLASPVPALRRRWPRLPRLSWPTRGRAVAHLGIGVLVNGLYLTLAYRAIGEGLPAGVMALIGSWQPVLTVVLTFLVARHRPSGLALAAIAVSLVGVGLVLAPGLAGQAHAISWFLVALAAGAVSSLTVGTMMQRRVSTDALVPSMAWQALGGAACALVVALVRSETALPLTPAILSTLAWSVLANSIVGMALMVFLVRRVGATYVSTIILAAPPLAAIEALLIFGEALVWLQWLGIAVTLAGVALTQASTRKDPSG